jgi:hypothetical protein
VPQDVPWPGDQAAPGGAVAGLAAFKLARPLWTVTRAGTDLRAFQARRGGVVVCGATLGAAHRRGRGSVAVVTAPEGGWRHNIGGFERHYSAWRIDSDGLTYGAQRRTERGPRGPKLKAGSLDELAALIDAADGA